MAAGGGRREGGRKGRQKRRKRGSGACTSSEKTHPFSAPASTYLHCGRGLGLVRGWSSAALPSPNPRNIGPPNRWGRNSRLASPHLGSTPRFGALQPLFCPRVPLPVPTPPSSFFLPSALVSTESTPVSPGLPPFFLLVPARLAQRPVLSPLPSIRDNVSLVNGSQVIFNIPKQDNTLRTIIMLQT